MPSSQSILNYRARIRRRAGETFTTKINGGSSIGASSRAQMSLGEVAKVLGVSRQAVYQVERTALHKLRMALLPTLREINPELAAQYE